MGRLLILKARFDFEHVVMMGYKPRSRTIGTAKPEFVTDVADALESDV